MDKENEKGERYCTEEEENGRKKIETRKRKRERSVKKMINRKGK